MVSRQSALEGMAVSRSSSPSSAFWKERRVLLTGHTGFKGAWLTWWLCMMGARVTGLALAPATTPSLYQLLELQSLCDSHLVDIRDAGGVADCARSADPEIVFHLAAQALVRPAYRAPVDSFSTNVMGTVHLLEALRHLPHAKVAVMVTTDKVYRNREWPWPYRESDTLGGQDPYSASKAASELAIECWRKSYLDASGVAISSARAGNVIGGGDWAEDRLLPDAIRAWQAGQTLEVRRPEAVRPWQHVLDPLAGYMTLAERLWATPELAGAWNFGPPSSEAASVRQVIELARQTHPGAQVRYAHQPEGPHEAGLLTLESARAQQVLGVSCRFSLSEAVTRTANWHMNVSRGESAASACARDIDDWMEARP